MVTLGPPAYAILSKDNDFKARSVLRGAPPDVIWLRVGNCSPKALSEEFCVVDGPDDGRA